MQSAYRERYLPNFERLSTVAATMLLAYALARIIQVPVQDLSLQLPGLLLTFELNLRTVVTLLVAGLTTAGADWLIRDHPKLGNQIRFEHWLLPTLTAWVIGVLLFQLPIGLLWWAGFVLGGAFLMAVLVAEYIVIDDHDDRQPLASAGLTVVSFALYLILAASLRFAEMRLYLILPALILAGGLASLRTLHLRLHGQWAILNAGIVALVVGQVAAALHYWPLSPTSYGLALVGPAYSLTSLMASLLEGKNLPLALIEPALIIIIVSGMAVLLR